MLWNMFDIDRQQLDNQYKNPAWNTDSGIAPADLQKAADRLIADMTGQPKPLIKAKVFELVLLNSQIEINPRDWFADRLNHGGVMAKLRDEWRREIDETVMLEGHRSERLAWSIGAYYAFPDFSHTSPDWNNILQLGVTGLLKRIQDTHRKRLDAGDLTDEQKVFYDSAEIVYHAVIQFILRLSDEAVRLSGENEKMLKSAGCLKAIASRAPKTMYEALQLAYIFRMLQEEVEGERVRSMGGFDRLYYPFYKNDLENGTYTKEQEKEFIKYFFNKFYALRTGNNQPIYLGGVYKNGSDAVNELTYLALETYDEINIDDPKFQLRVHKNISDDLLRTALRYIHKGTSSIVFVNDEAAIPALMKVGIPETEAREYVPIGCYEPAVLGREVPCSGSVYMNIAKAAEFAIYNGVDMLTGTKFGPETGDCSGFGTFGDFYAAFNEQLRYMLETSIQTTIDYERYYMEINPSPLFSSTMSECVERGKDAYAGGAQYNNSAVCWGGLANTVDFLTAVRQLVFDEKAVTMWELADILKRNWDGHERLRMKMLINREKFGNNKSGPDGLAREITDYIAGIVNNRPNGRGGIFKSGLLTITYVFHYGAKMGATPDGRKAYEPLAKNLCAVSCMDREGITSLINSVTKIDYSNLPNGSVLDIILHPSAVQGKEGLDAMLGLVKTYFKQGGFAIHGNVFDENTLRNAQENPEKYATLQVRVCGWNAYFVDLSKPEQDEFIRLAKHAAS